MKEQVKMQARVFDTDKRIRLGIWGLGRGMHFYNTCKYLNIDVVAGCDYNQHMRDAFLKANPGAYVTADADEFLKQDFDAVLLATFCPAHADDAIKCIQAGKHVLSEVTAFFTMAEGVRLVEEVEKRKLVYNLAENYPFTAANMWLAARWKEGLFGELMYGEYEYVHECRSLCYTYIDGLPVQPGHSVHNWRSWLNFHYYCTHSLGPAMVITGTRPVRVESFPATPRIAGYLGNALANGGGLSPSLIRMSNGGVVRNLMGAATNDSHQQRLWGTLGAAEIGHDGLKLRLGASGDAPMFKVAPQWEGLGELAAQTGHDGGDFWTLYYFAREIFTGEKGPFDIYGAADVTIPGILACRSSHEDGQPFDVPDFRKKAEREKFRDDHWAQERFDTKTVVFGAGAKITGKAGRFTAVMKDLIELSTLYRAYADWKKVLPSMDNPEDLLPVAVKLQRGMERLRTTYQEARELIVAYPKTEGARTLAEMLAVGEERNALALGQKIVTELKKEVAAAKNVIEDRRRAAAETRPGCLGQAEATAIVKSKKGIAAVGLPGPSLKFSPVKPLFSNASNMFDIRPLYRDGVLDGLAYARCRISLRKAVAGSLRIGADGPFKAFLNGQEIACDPEATNPIEGHVKTVPARWKKGVNEVVVAMLTTDGNAYGFLAEAILK
jgi:hypothetical protein